MYISVTDLQYCVTAPTESEPENPIFSPILLAANNEPVFEAS